MIFLSNLCIFDSPLSSCPPALLLMPRLATDSLRFSYRTAASSPSGRKTQSIRRAPSTTTRRCDYSPNIDCNVQAERCRAADIVLFLRRRPRQSRKRHHSRERDLLQPVDSAPHKTCIASNLAIGRLEIDAKQRDSCSKDGLRERPGQCTSSAICLAIWFRSWTAYQYVRGIEFGSTSMFARAREACSSQTFLDKA